MSDTQLFKKKLKPAQKSLVRWTDQKWTTSDGSKSSESGNRYLPKKAWEALTPYEKAVTNKEKKEGGGAGNYVKQSDSIVDKVRKYRKAQHGESLFSNYKTGGSTVNAAGNYTKPEMRKKLFNNIKSQDVMGTKSGMWSARKSQLLAKKYKENGGGYFQIGGLPDRYKKLGFTRHNEVKNAPQGDSHKKMVVAKKGDDYKIVKFGFRGMQDYTQHRDLARRKSYLSRSAGIVDKNGKKTKDDVFSANHWSRKILW